MKRVIVIGGGAAGMMAAIAAAENGREVFLIEKNEKLGKKLFITGKGRCNVTNAGDMDILFENVVSNSSFLYSAFYGFNNQDMMRFLESAGCKLKVERGERVFPASDHSSDVLAAFNRELKKNKVRILLNTQVKELLTDTVSNHGRAEEKRIKGVRLQDSSCIMGDCVIIAAGGLSYPLTGSTGDGYRMAEEAGHTLVECRPSLVPFIIEESWCGELMGLALKNVDVRLMDGRKEIYHGFGEILFTHFGISGPLILSASSYYVKRKMGRAQLYIDLKPALSEEQLDIRILRDFEENRNKQFKNILSGLFPVRLIPVMIKLSGIHPDKKVNEITRKERKEFISLIKKLPLHVTGCRDFQEAIITQGGVSVKEVDPSTMASKKVMGLYFAGEVLDLDALTGGFNLQIAWSTGYLAGKSC